MVSSDVLHQRNASESSLQPHETSRAETLSQRHLPESSEQKRIESDAVTNVVKDCHVTINSASASGASKALITQEPQADNASPPLAQLQHALADLRTANKAKDVQLRTTRTELKTARDTLATTFAEYCGIRDEMKMLRHNITKEHQAIVYRKDIELFALRKGNEQKEKYIQEHEAKVQEQQEEMSTLKEKLASLGWKGAKIDGEEALEVRVLKVKKGRKSISIESLRDESTINTLRESLAAAQTAAEMQKGELQRAWDIAKNRQAAIKIERELHAQTKEQLQKMTEGGGSPGRLPTITENNDELEAMYDASQVDNRRLYAENAALETRLRDSNARLFTAAREAEELKIQNATQADVIQAEHFQRVEAQLTSARCSLTVKEHQLAFLKQALSEKMDKMDEAKEQLDAAVAFHTQDQDEIERLKGVVRELRKANREHERLALVKSKSRTSTAGSGTAGEGVALQPTKSVPGQDGLVLQPTKSPSKIPAPSPRVPDRNSSRSNAGPAPPSRPSGERTSARSSTTLMSPALPPPTASSARSSTTLTNELSSPSVDPISALSPMPEEERPSSIQNTPTRHIRPDMQLINNDIPPAELRANKRRSWDLRGRGSALVKKIVKRDASPTTNDRAALGSKDKNAPVRPKTATPAPPSTTSKQRPSSDDPFITSALPPMPPAYQRRVTPRYYAIPGPAQPQNLHEYRPTTGVDGGLGVRAKRASLGMGFGMGGKGKETLGEDGKEGEGRTPRKLKRRSIY